jgi:bifunctional UDP-N-acetylglucosamine pyrophosphorylase/glucosamine-1-phosphate N-acetyltransferase
MARRHPEIVQTPPAAILCDMDGVLLDSESIHAEAFREVLSSEGIQDFCYLPYAGWRTAEVIEQEFRRHRRPVDPSRIVQLSSRKTQAAGAALARLNPVFPGVLDSLERLSIRFPLALVSSGSEANVRTFLKINDLEGLFGAVVHGGDVARAKPAPDPYLLAARRLGVDPPKCLVLEDSDSGEQSARAAGCDVRRIGPDFRFADVPAWLGLNSLPPVVRHVPNAAVLPDSGEWTAIIPAAGKGTRLGAGGPKILFEVAGRTILRWLLDLLAPRCAHIIIVAAPATQQEIRQAAAGCPVRVSVAVQPEPLGMGDAVERGLALTRSGNVLVIWGDQPAIREESIDAALRIHTSACAIATIPTVIRHKPYIHFERDEQGSIVRVLQAREGDAMPAEGESDAGVFLFRTRPLRRCLQTMSLSGESLGQGTRERNLLPVIPQLDGLPGQVISARIMSEEESVGVNTPAEARYLSEVLSSRRAARQGGTSWQLM